MPTLRQNINIIKGDELWLFIGLEEGQEVPTCFSTQHNLDYSYATIPISSKDHGDNSYSKLIESSWTCSTSALMSMTTTDANSMTFVNMMNACDQKKLVYVKFGKLANYTQGGIVDVDINKLPEATREGWELEGPYWEGKGYITSLQVRSDHGNVASYSIEITGTGPLTKVEPEPLVKYDIYIHNRTGISNIEYRAFKYINNSYVLITKAAAGDIVYYGAYDTENRCFTEENGQHYCISEILYDYTPSFEDPSGFDLLWPSSRWGWDWEFTMPSTNEIGVHIFIISASATPGVLRLRSWIQFPDADVEYNFSFSPELPASGTTSQILEANQGEIVYITAIDGSTTGDPSTIQYSSIGGPNDCKLLIYSYSAASTNYNGNIEPVYTTGLNYPIGWKFYMYPAGVELPGVPVDIRLLDT